MTLVNRSAPLLGQLGGRLRSDHLLKFISAPHDTKAGTAMPDLFHGARTDEKSRQTEAIASYLLSTGRLMDRSGDTAAAKRGEDSFHAIGCAACHAPRRGDADLDATSVPLGDLTAKYSLDSLSRFLANPHAVRPSGLMPKVVNDMSEARDIACYLLGESIIVPGAEQFQANVYFGSWDNLPDFEISGDYHEYAFGSKFDKDGAIWVALCLTGSFDSNVAYRGNCVRIMPDGKTVPTAYGLRSPGGIAFNHVGDVFYTDNQGPWNGTCGLKQLVPGKFVGHPGGNKWMDKLPEFSGKKTIAPQNDSRMMIEVEKHPDLIPTAIMFPYGKMGQSASGISCDTTNGKFGPFVNQLFVGDQTQSTIMRVDMEVVNGRYQGACFPFRAGFASGVVGVEMDASGALFVGGTNRGWGSRGPKDFAVERLNWTGKMPFEIQTMRVQPRGFKLTFTKPVDAKSAGDVASY